MALIEELWKVGETLIPADILPRLKIKGFWNIELHFQPHVHERVFTCHCLIAQTHHQGCCFYEGITLQEQEVLSLIGQPYQDAKRASLPIKIAVLDSLFGFGKETRQPARQLSKEGTPSEKALWRAKIVCEEIQRLAPPHVQITILGVSSLIVYQLIQLGYHNISACDLDPTLVGSKIQDKIIVLNGSYQDSCIENADIAIVTGMALATETMERILKSSLAHNTRVIVYAQTGANLAPWYLLCGADVVICEHIPFYNFEGISEICVHRRQRK